MTLKQEQDVQIFSHLKWCRLFLLYSVKHFMVGVGTFIVVLNMMERLSGLFMVILLMAILPSSLIGTVFLFHCYRSVRETENKISEARSTDLQNIAGR